MNGLYDSIDQSHYSVQHENNHVLETDLGHGNRPRTSDDIRLRRNLPNSFMIVRQKPTQTFIFRILMAMNLDFHSQT